MTAYLVNLAEKRDRLQCQETQFRELGLAFERVDACVDDLRRFDRFRWWCAVLRPLAAGEVGCALSHLKVYRRMLERDEPCAAIFEDDLAASAALPKALAAAERKCREDPKAVVLLADHRRLPCGEPLAAADAALGIAATDWDYCAEGYVIGKQAAATLLKRRRRIHVPADYWRYFRLKGWINLYRVSPPVCGQLKDRFATSIGSKYVVEGKPRCERLWWKARRVVGVVIDCLLDGGRRGF